MRYVLSRVAYQDKDERVVGRPDPLIVGPASLLHEKGERGALPAGDAAGVEHEVAARSDETTGRASSAPAGYGAGPG